MSVIIRSLLIFSCWAFHAQTNRDLKDWTLDHAWELRRYSVSAHATHRDYTCTYIYLNHVTRPIAQEKNRQTGRQTNRETLVIMRKQTSQLYVPKMLRHLTVLLSLQLHKPIESHLQRLSVGVLFVSSVPHLSRSFRSVQGRGWWDGCQGEGCRDQSPGAQGRLRAAPQEAGGVLHYRRAEGMGVCARARLSPLRQVHRTSPADLCKFHCKKC